MSLRAAVLLSTFPDLGRAAWVGVLSRVSSSYIDGCSLCNRVSPDISSGSLISSYLASSFFFLRSAFINSLVSIVTRWASSLNRSLILPLPVTPFSCMSPSTFFSSSFYCCSRLAFFSMSFYFVANAICTLKRCLTLAAALYLASACSSKKSSISSSFCYWRSSSVFRDWSTISLTRGSIIICFISRRIFD